MKSLQNRILDAALPSVVFDGWTQTTFENAAKSIGLTAFDVKRAFPNGPIDIANFWRARVDDDMLKALTNDYDLPSMKVRERIATAVMVRLRQILPYREAVRRCLAFYALPWHAGDAVQALYSTVDVMWKAAGDTSTDYNFYTKRLLLSGVYSSTLTVWLDDTTPDLADTEAFLRRRIDNVMQIEKAKAQAREHFSKLSGWMPDLKKKA